MPAYSDYHSTFTTITAIAAAMLSMEFFRVVRVRRSRYPWASYAIGAALGVIALERLVELCIEPVHFTAPELLANYMSDLTVLLAAICIPLVRAGAYRRVPTSELKNINAQLTYTQQLFSEFMNTVPAFSLIQDAASKVVFVNEYWTKMFGVAKEDLLGKSHLPPNLPFSDLGKIDAQLHSQFLDVLSSSKRKTITVKLRINGTPRTLLIVRFPLKNLRNEPMVGGVAVDITERLVRRRSLSISSSLIQLSPDAIYYYDRDRIVRFWNLGAKRMLGRASDEAVGRPLSSFFPHERVADVDTITDRLAKEEVITGFETEHITADGERRRIDLAGVHLTNLSGRGSVFACVARDVTERKKIEEQIKRLNRVLETRLAELSETNANLKTVRDKALASSGMKLAFVANVSHELRTPLAGILGTSDLLLKHGIEGDPGNLVGMIHESAQALLYLVNEILDLSRLEFGKASVNLERFSPRQLIDDCNKLLLPAAARKGIALLVALPPDLPPYVLGDESKVRQLLLSLTSNAIKFTKTGTVTVKAEVDGVDNSHPSIRFSVIDTGCGIPADQLNLLFTPFSSVGESMHRTGSQLGLIISKRLCEMMGGRIGCESVRGAGSIFWFEIGFKQAAKPLPAEMQQATVLPAESARKKLAELKVLAVEDNPLLSRLVQMQLRLVGVGATESAGTGEDAIQKARNGQFDAILMDIQLPDITGYEVTAAIRSDAICSGVPRSIIIALTASVDATGRKQALDSGMDDFLSKPVTIEQMRETFLKWFPQEDISSDLG